MTDTKPSLPSHTTSGGILGGNPHSGGGFMGAEVHACGFAYHLYEEVDFMEKSPQIHVHFLTSDKDLKRVGHGKIELVCHGCGKAILLMYNTKGPDISVRRDFEKKHAKCPNHGYEDSCPNYRSRIDILDMRKKLKKIKSSRR
jgi:hypothetical protein